MVGWIATENNGQTVGLFCYSVNTTDNIGFLKFVIVDKTNREKGYGKEILNLALQYAFQITGANAIQPINILYDNISENIQFYNPWEVCSSAQLIIELR